jgi:hypothetical protein
MNGLVPVRTLAVALLVAAGVTACSSPTADSSASHGTATKARPASDRARTELTGSLASPVDVVLTWTGEEPGAAGHVVEFATDPKGPYTILGYLPPGRHSYHHPDLMPHTPFYYRVRPYYGPASRPIEVDLPDGARTARERTRDPSWATPRTLRGQPVTTASIRSTSGTDAAAPTDLRATVMQANGIRFTWHDHADDEQGYLLEDRPRGSHGFLPVAALDPDVTSFGLITLPSEKQASYRVRPYYFGQRSNVVHFLTGTPPDDHR